MYRNNIRKRHAAGFFPEMQLQQDGILSIHSEEKSSNSKQKHIHFLSVAQISLQAEN